MSVAFLFGAGASAFSGECFPRNPPLGTRLFRELERQGGVASTVGSDVAALFDDDFEAGMAEFRRQREVETTRFLRDIARYFAQFSPGPGNAYASLVKTLMNAPRPAVLATLNYDLLIEIAVSSLGRRIAYHGLPAPPGNFSVLKLHGSCNFLPDLGRRSIRGIGFVLSDPGSSILEAPVKAVDVPAILEFCHNEDSLAPAIALYAKGKSVLVCPDFVRQQQLAWKQTTKDARQIFVVGVKVNDEDAHVWLPLQRSKAQLFYVGPDSQPFLDWAQLHNRKRAYHMAESFEAALPQIAARVTRV